jgi:hypothetical protein
MRDLTYVIIDIGLKSLIFLSFNCISGDKLNTYRDLLKEMSAMVYIPMSVRDWRDITSTTYKTLQQLHVIFTSHEETRLLLVEVRFYCHMITKCNLQHNVM